LEKEEGGKMPTPRYEVMDFSRKKAKWKAIVAQTLLEVDDIARRFEGGQHIGMSELYGTARDVQKLGVRAEEMIAEVNAGRRGWKRKDRVLESFGATCQLLEVGSKLLEHILDSQTTPAIDFPTYVAGLRTTSVIDTEGKLEHFEALRKKIER